jgi:hypothetical protein
MSKIPPIDSLSDFVGTILAFMPDIEKAKSVVAAIQSSNQNKLKINIKGNPTKQGRYALQIEGSLPKEYALQIMQCIENFEGEIEVVAGK